MTWEEFVDACIPSPHTVSVEIYQGSGGYGAVYAAPSDLGPCVVEDTARSVNVQTDTAQGTARVSSTTVYAPLSPTVPPGSRVTVPWRTQPATVLAVARMDDHGLALPAHQELSLE